MVRIIISHLFLDSKLSKKEIEKETLAFDLQNAEFLVFFTMDTAYPCLQRTFGIVFQDLPNIQA